MTACQAIHRALHARVWAQLRHLLTTTFGAGTREAPEVANWRNHPPLRQPLHRPSLHVTLAFAADAKAAIQGVEVYAGGKQLWKALKLFGLCVSRGPVDELLLWDEFVNDMSLGIRKQTA